MSSAFRAEVARQALRCGMQPQSFGVWLQDGNLLHEDPFGGYYTHLLALFYPEEIEHRAAVYDGLVYAHSGPLAGSTFYLPAWANAIHRRLMMKELGRGALLEQVREAGRRFEHSLMQRKCACPG